MSKSDNIRAGNVWVDIQQVFYRMEENVNGCYAQKPLKSCERIVRASSNPGDLVLDFFAHSGSTLLASEMLVRRCDEFRRDDLRYRQWALIRNDRLYVLGDFATLGSVDADFDVATQVRDLLAHWKANHPELLERFDLDGDGAIDLREWELARAQAKREVRRLQAEVLAAPELHVMRRPEGGRLFLISDRDPEQIGRNYRWLAVFHACVFLGATAAGAWFVQIGVI